MGDQSPIPPSCGPDPRPAETRSRKARAEGLRLRAGLFLICHPGEAAKTSPPCHPEGAKRFEGSPARSSRNRSLGFARDDTLDEARARPPSPPHGMIYEKRPAWCPFGSARASFYALSLWPNLFGHDLRGPGLQSSQGRSAALDRQRGRRSRAGASLLRPQRRGDVVPPDRQSVYTNANRFRPISSLKRRSRNAARSRLPSLLIGIPAITTLLHSTTALRNELPARSLHSDVFYRHSERCPLQTTFRKP